MSSKTPVNIFETLRDNESSDDETMKVVKTKDPNQKRLRPKKNKDTPQPAVGATQVEQPEERSKENVQRTKLAKDQKPDRKVSGDAHPKDR
jgi:hypothetical protein